MDTVALSGHIDLWPITSDMECPDSLLGVVLLSELLHGMPRLQVSLSVQVLGLHKHSL